MFIPKATPEELGISSQRIIAILSALRELDSLNSLMIMRHGKCCLEAYWRPFTPESSHALFSLSKSFVSVAIGFARAEGRLKLNDKLVAYFPEYADAITDDKMREVTLEDLLTMRSGHAACPNGIVLPSQNWARAFLASKLDFQPGTHFAYNSCATYMLAAIVKKLTGQNVREYLIPRLFAPMDIEPGLWECCPMGINKGGWGLFLKTEDIAKFAQLLLQKGQLDGRQIIPADYFAEATVKHADNSMNQAPDWRQGYGYQFWRSQHGFRGDGASGQYAVVLPEEDMAIAVTAGVSDMQRILTIFWEQLLPGLAAEPLPANPDAQARVNEIKASLEIPVAKGNLSKRHDNVCFQFQDNEDGIVSAELQFRQDDCILAFHYQDGHDDTIHAGFGYRIKNTLLLKDPFPLQVFASAAWQENKLVFDLCNIACYRDQFILDFDNPETPFERSRRLGAFQPVFAKLKVK